MRKINNSQLMSTQSVQLFTRGYQSVINGSQADEENLKALLELTKDVYKKGYSKNMASGEDQFHAGFYIKDLPDSLPNGECRNDAKGLYERYIYNHYMIDPSQVVDYIDKYFDELKNNVYTYLLIINLIVNTTEWELPDHMIYQFNQLFNRIEGL